ncbi:hypothetical protein Hanom_Chr16g01522771 [Helianthus anomalus]
MVVKGGWWWQTTTRSFYKSSTHKNQFLSTKPLILHYANRVFHYFRRSKQQTLSRNYRCH